MPSQEPKCSFNFEADYFKAYSNFLPKFMVTMKPSYVTERSIAIPKNFAKEHLKMKQAPVSLKVLGEESTWKITFKTWTGNGITKYKFHGWRSFATANHLQEGDTCEFIMTNTTPIRFTVVIDRATKNHSCSKSEAKKSVVAEDGTAWLACSNLGANSDYANTAAGTSLPRKFLSDVLLKRFLVSHANMHSSIQKFPESLRQFLYSSLAELIKLLKSLPILELQLKHKDTISDHLATFRHCSLSNAWLDELEACFNQPLPAIDTHRLQALRDLELQYSKSNDNLRREVSSLSYLLKVGEANLLDVITQKQKLLGASSSLDAFFPLGI